MSWLETLFREGWPMLAALAIVGAITYGALRPYLKRDAAQSRKLEQDDD
ncbi:MAG: hypothetical protein GDA40_07125 [Rhodobacteraceae bacterium]|nr:hypothetical protein [Paracoccaceae bacterium]